MEWQNGKDVQFLFSLVLTTLLEISWRKLGARLPLVRAAQKHFTT